MAPGWTKKDGTATAEEIQANFAQIQEPGDYIIGTSIADEMKAVMAALSD
jgi:hypothetical protein